MRISANPNYNLPPKTKSKTSIKERVWYTNLTKAKLKKILEDEIQSSINDKTRQPPRRRKAPPKPRPQPKPTASRHPPSPVHITSTRRGDQNIAFLPVDRHWQLNRATVMACEVHRELLDEPMIPELPADTVPVRTLYTQGDGNCFFRSISLYLTGREDSDFQHLRNMMIRHVQRNLDVFKAFTNKTDAAIITWINKKSQNKAGARFDDHWADFECIAVMSNLLQTPIYSFSPQVVNVQNRFSWHRTDPTTFAAVNFTYTHDLMTETMNGIYLDNRGSHFAPCSFQQL